MNQLKLSLFAFVLLFISIAMAHGDDIHLNKLNYCNVTKITMNDYEPAVFETTNNLLRKAGEKPIYCGEKIIVHGRVLDQNCVPVSDAIVYAWQANCNGKYPYQPLKTIIDKELINVDPNITFTGNGTATTNNKGEFHFVTVYPPAMHENPSHINIRIEHHRLGSLQTSLVLRGKKVNNPEANPELGSIADVVAEHDINIYDFEIVLPGSVLKEY